MNSYYRKYLCIVGRGQDDCRTLDTIVFNDGSKYTGTLKNGVPDGLGSCTWVDGNQYDGEWRIGVMHGFGTYLWTSGQRYDGEWKVSWVAALGSLPSIADCHASLV